MYDICICATPIINIYSYDVVEMEVQIVLEYPLHDLIEGGFLFMFQNVH
jgi:hypothetical protein